MVSNPAAPPPPPIEAVEPAAEPLRMSALLEPREEAPGGSAVSPHGPLAALSKGSRAGCFFLIRFLRSLSSACRPQQKEKREVGGSGLGRQWRAVGGGGERGGGGMACLEVEDRHAHIARHLLAA